MEEGWGLKFSVWKIEKLGGGGCGLGNEAREISSPSHMHKHRT